MRWQGDGQTVVHHRIVVPLPLLLIRDTKVDKLHMMMVVMVMMNDVNSMRCE